MILLVLGFFMRFLKQKQARVNQARLSLANAPLTDAQKG
jgi:hypothetical protein